ncbi:NRAMP-like transporter smf-2 [Caenorhabditis elegans]|uniref:NRAMP-like transporter smf-2 n=1 Tax=Caenorhabditis elegans TaxID=6239 RepID=NRAMB_CAEEL|nr:NRAMP-like transporter smf-2 [Caenorhabditis elegans]Q21433.2 RecName: Full=NRAMP-like transporter smf-2; AltName: Full=Divalent metal transporter smf-2 [Caenorhabditis elegans]CCD70795.2 NRAMP-like transporter smf-2 [Caenorhabditis elegans]|eukprot:NP_509131.2 NRAMP-like transporter smf-2 [Caenorhabditis elegans]
MPGFQNANISDLAPPAREKTFDDTIAVKIPEDEKNTWFSWRKLWAFTGPGFLMSIAYLDPGNIESDLQAGAQAEYKLLWVLLVSHIVGMLLQRMSARLGVVSGKHMAEIAYDYYPLVPRIILWLMIEIAIVCSDMQEVIGTAIAIYLLSSGKIPLLVGVLITILDTFTFLFIDRYGIRKLEFIFVALISTMAISFGYEFVVMKPVLTKVLTGTVVPWCSGCGKEEIITAISIFGAVIMPHNFYLHSALVKSRKVDRSSKTRIAEANKYFSIESAFALSVSFFINLFVLSVFARGLYQKTNGDVNSMCLSHNDIPDSNVFPNNTSSVTVDLFQGGIYLGCQFGLFAMIIWAIGIFAAGQSSTMTGTYTGQFVMEGFVRISWPKWKRVLITRAVAITPTLILCIKAHGIKNLTGMNDFLNCVQMVQLPFALIPMITFTSSKRIMHNFRTSKPLQYFSIICGIITIGINVYFIFQYVTENFGTGWLIFVIIGPFTLLYIAFILYLAIYCLVACELMNDTVNLPGFDFHRTLELDAPWITETFVVNDVYF